jgi:hypothetical protein
MCIVVLNESCCYKMVDFDTATSQNRVCITQQILLHDCSMIRDEIN